MPPCDLACRWVHVVNNVVMQLFLGVLLEMVHKWWRVLIVYTAGVVAGSLATSLTDPDYYLAGASGGVYALITAHMATVILVRHLSPTLQPGASFGIGLFPLVT
jgi:membrane associated rhomboid family serine protease